MFLLPNSYWHVKNTPKKGKGVFATHDIQPGRVIGDYVGTVISADNEDKYEKKYGFYIMYYNENASVVPDLKKDGIHLINHSCTPNCGFYTYKGHTIYFSLRKIFKGEELTVSYQLSPQDEDCKPCTHQCYCKSFLCAQTMHLPEEKYDKWTQFDEKITKKTKRERVKVGKSLPPLSSYPQTIPDYSLYTLFGSTQKDPIRYSDTILPPVNEIRSRIRETGRFLRFDKLHLTVYGVIDGLLISNRK